MIPVAAPPPAPRGPLTRRARFILGPMIVAACAQAGWAQSTARLADSMPARGHEISLTVPGGTAGLAKAVGFDAAGPRARVLLDVIRLAYEIDAGRDSHVDERRMHLREYLEAISAFERASRALPLDMTGPGPAAPQRQPRLVDQFAAAIGSRVAPASGGFKILVSDRAIDRRRQELLQMAGLDIPALSQALNAGSALAPRLPAEEVPLPLPEASWRQLARSAADADLPLVAVILGDRRLALLCYGLSSVDAPTRAFIGSRADLLAGLTKGIRPGSLASFGRSIKVAEGRVEVPGGPSAAPLWEALAGERVSDPARFILTITEKDGGQLLLFYDTVGHLGEPVRSLALGSGQADAGVRLDRLRRLYRAFQPSLGGWNVGLRPFVRIADDAGHFLLRIRADHSGKLAAPAGRRLWESVLGGGGIEARASSDSSAFESDKPLDLADLVRLTCVSDALERWERVDTWLFAHRVFESAPPSAMHDVVVALRAYPRFRLLGLTLERIGIADPAIYAAGMRIAERWSRLKDRARLVPAYALFQGALSLVDRARLSRSITTETASRLVRSLFALPLSDRGEYLGAVAAWFDSEVLPLLPPAAGVPGVADGVDSPIESRVVAWSVGLRSGRIAASDVVWESLRYTVDLEAAEFSRVSRIRTKQGGLSLDAVLGFCRTVSALQSTVTSPAAGPLAASLLAANAQRLNVPAESGPATGLALPEVRRVVAGAVGSLRGLASGGDLAELPRVSDPLRRLGDRLLGTVLASLAYAPNVGDPNGMALLGGDPALRHDFGIDTTVDRVRVISPWRLAEEETGERAGWRGVGSLLALDVGFARLSLRRAATENVPLPPTVTDNDRAAITRMVAVLNPFDVSDADQRAIVDAMRRGRALVSGLPARPDRLPDLLGRTTVGEWQRAVLPWVLDRDPQRVLEYFSLVDLIRIGESEATPVPHPERWGAFGLAVDGCLCASFPDEASWESYAGVRGRPLVASRVPDLALRIAETLDVLGLPARLARPVAGFAIQELLDMLRPAHPDDWTAIAGAVRSLSPARVEDFIAALTASGPLVPNGRD